MKLWLGVFVLPSLWEGSGLVLPEVMAARRPIVASRVSAIPEVVENGISGILVPPGDAGAVAGAVQALYGDPARRERMGLAGEARVRMHFSVLGMVH